MTTTCQRDHEVDRAAAAALHPGSHEQQNVYKYRDGRLACLKCTRAQWRRQWARKSARRLERAA
jgi:hypothetical protein